MTSTIPTTLTEYQQFVRTEALKVQVDMGWPDEKLNATLKALGLPEKLNFQVPVEVTAKMFVLINAPDADSQEAAEAVLKDKGAEDLRQMLRDAGASVGHFHGFTAATTVRPTTFAEGDLDTTMSNPTVAHALGRGKPVCEVYHSSGSYCTRERGHTEGDHAAGDARRIIRTWA